MLPKNTAAAAAAGWMDGFKNKEQKQAGKNNLVFPSNLFMSRSISEVATHCEGQSLTPS